MKQGTLRLKRLPRGHRRSRTRQILAWLDIFRPASASPEEVAATASREAIGVGKAADGAVGGLRYANRPGADDPETRCANRTSADDPETRIEDRNGADRPKSPFGGGSQIGQGMDDGADEERRMPSLGGASA